MPQHHLPRLMLMNHLLSASLLLVVTVTMSRSLFRLKRVRCAAVTCVITVQLIGVCFHG